MSDSNTPNDQPIPDATPHMYHHWQTLEGRVVAQGMKKDYRPCYARIISGEVVQYDIASKSQHHNTNWDDIVYLGIGNFCGHAPEAK